MNILFVKIVFNIINFRKKAYVTKRF